MRFATRPALWIACPKGGKPVIRGTRLAVEFVLGLIAQGWSEQEIARNYPLTPDQIRATVAYAQERLADERLFLVAA